MAKKRTNVVNGTQMSHTSHASGATVKQDSQSELAVWLSCHPGYLRDMAELKSEQSNAFIRQCWPFSESYYSPLNSIFSVQVLSAKMFKRRPCWLLRDGLVPLLWFFKINPQPHASDSVLIIPGKFAEMVPDKWKSRVKYYQLVQSTQPPQDPKRLLVAGIVGGAHSDLELVSQQLKALKTNFGPAIDELEKLYFLSPRVMSTKDQSFLFETFQRFFSELGVSGRSVDWAELCSPVQTSSTILLSLNSDLTIYDDHLTHILASNGVYQLHLKTVASKSEISIPLSPHHGIKVFDTIDEFKAWEHADALVPRHDVMKVFGHNIYVGMPWPQYFTVTA